MDLSKHIRFNKSLLFTLHGLPDKKSILIFHEPPILCKHFR
jgi:hypothetical protein